MISLDRGQKQGSNQGLPFLKDVPLLGALLGQQNNTRARTELLVPISPHVIYKQREARTLSQDLREHLPNTALVPAILNNSPPSGSSDPNEALGDSLGLH